MCGGVVYNLERVPEEDLSRYYSKDQIQYFKRKGMISSFYWDKHPALPAEIHGQVRLFNWGSRDKNTPFPQTGWAKNETIKKGKWKWLHPKDVNIPVRKGYEKKVWFDFKHGTKGILVDSNGEKRIYMVTEEADKKYFNETHHNRMPMGEKLNFIKPVPNNDKKPKNIKI